MRKMQFRAWDGVDNMSKPFTLYGVQAGITKVALDCTIMQYTGLKDKNGKEIYEGDIVKWQIGMVTGVNDITYHDARFRINSSFQDDMSLYESHASVGVEVIGNIYENPDLLETSDETD